jgi:hypothetical protein
MTDETALDPEVEATLAGIWRRMKGDKVVHMYAADIATLFELHRQGKINMPVEMQAKLRNAIVVEGGKH